MKLIALAVSVLAVLPLAAQSGNSYDNAPAAITLVSPTGSGPFTSLTTTGSSGPSYDYAQTILMLGYNSSTNKYYVCGTANPCVGGGGGSGGTGTVSPGTGSAGSPAVYTTATGTSVNSSPNGCVFTSTGLNSCALGQTTQAAASVTTMAVGSASPLNGALLSVSGNSPVLDVACTNVGYCEYDIHDNSNVQVSSLGYGVIAGTSSVFFGPRNGTAPLYFITGSSPSVRAAMLSNGNWCFGNTTCSTQVSIGSSEQFKVSAAGVVTAPSVRSGVSTNTDLDGVLTLAGGTASYTFTGTYTTAPICVVSDTSALAASRPVVTTTTLTITGTGTDVVSYICTGRN